MSTFAVDPLAGVPDAQVVQVTILPDRHVLVAGTWRRSREVVDVTAADARTLIAEGYALFGTVDLTVPAPARIAEPPLPEGGERLRKLPGATPRRKPKPTEGAP